MRVIPWEMFGAVRDGLEGARLALSVGVFDGVHRGHRELIGRVMAAPGIDARGVVTFAANPKQVLRPGTFAGEISSLAQRLAAFAALGLDFAVLIDFSGEFSTLSGKEFIAALASRREIRYVAIGENFHCGHRMDTDSASFARLAGERGIVVDTVPPFTISGETVSSSRIRADIAAGRLAEAGHLLGRLHALDLGSRARERGEGRWQAGLEGFPQILPPRGDYDARVLRGGATVPAKLSLRIGGDLLVWEESRGGERAAAGAAIELVCDRIDIDKE